MSTQGFEQLVATQKVGADALLTLIRSTSTGLERLTALNIAAARDFLNSSVANTQQVLAVKDVSDLSRVNANLLQPALEKWLDYSRNVYALANSLQKEVAAIAEGQYAQITKTATASLDKTKSAPGNDIIAATVKTFLDTSGRVYEQLNSISKQANAIAEANIQAVTNATTQVASAAKRNTTTKKQA
ncbi:MAG: phasin family protein [Zoogloeaceae bacterium]|jgi:phasin family protein|nr:phasin family protein [Zoogloeaceae bacterium]